jgi:RHS repeat-associated protein
VGNPILLARGYKIEQDTDAPLSGVPFALSRTYNSVVNPPYATHRATSVATGNVAVLGGGWFLDVGRRVQHSSGSTGEAVYVTRSNGQRFVFSRVGEGWVTDSDLHFALAPIAFGGGQSGWRLTDEEAGTVETYNADGDLVGLAPIGGGQYSLSYEGGKLKSVSDFRGVLMTFSHSPSGRIDTVTFRDGTYVQYGYDAKNLISVRRPDGSVRGYRYNEPGLNAGIDLPNALTGVVDENGVRYASFTYNAQRLAYITEHAGGVDKYQMNYWTVSTTVFDPLGTKRTYSLEKALGVWRNTGQTQPGGSGCAAASAALGYDANGNITARTDFSGHKACYAYDTSRNVETKRVEGLASGASCSTALATPPAPTAANPVRTIGTQWHPDWRLEVRRAEPKKITTWVYNGQPDPTNGDTIAACAPIDALLPDGKPIAVLCKKVEQATTDATGAAGFAASATGSPRIWTLTYTRYGQVLTADGPRTDVNDVTTYTYYDTDDSDIGKRGNLASVTNALGQVMQYAAYDPMGRVTEVVDPNGVITAFTYDPRGRMTSKSVGGETTQYTYDPVGQLTQVALPDGSGLTFSYDPAHRLTAITDAIGNSIQYTLDAAGNRTKEDVRGSGGTLARTRTMVYDALSRLYKEIGAQNQTTVYAYDADGNRTKVTDPLTQATVSGFDALERLIQITDPGAGVARLAYDGQDALITATDPRSLLTTYSPDGLGNLAGRVSPDTGSTVQSFDAAGNLLTRSDARGQSVQTQYDALNRPTQLSYADGRQTRYLWDLGLNGLGRLSQIDDYAAGQLVGRQTYAYDAQGRLLRQTQTLGALSHSLVSAYADGRLVGLTLPSGRGLAYGYDTAGRVTGITLSENGTTRPLVGGASYAPFGRLQGWTDAAGQAQTRSVDLDGRVTRYTAGGQAWNLSYDAAGRLIRVVDSADALWAVDYTYDSLDRLTRAVLPYASYSYGYDANGNRNSRTIGARGEAMTIAATSNRLLSLDSAPPVTYAYDATGNRSSDGRASYGYDSAGRLVEATSAVGTTRYEVNALNLRMKKSGPLGETVFVHDRDGRLVAEADAGGTIQREYVWLDDALLALLDGPPGSTQVYAVHPDPLGTPRAVTNVAGTTVWRNSPIGEPFGLLPPEPDPDGDGTAFVLNLRFPGQYFDQETNLAYNWHRSYDAQVGAYTQSDPIGLAGGQWSTYTYVGGQPTGKVDPEGLAALTIPLPDIPLPGWLTIPAGRLLGGLGVLLSLGGDTRQDEASASTTKNGGQCKDDDPCDIVLDKGQLKAAGIRGREHEVKADELGTNRHLSKFDLCGCKDGRVVVKAHGCKGPVISETRYTWK